MFTAPPGKLIAALVEPVRNSMKRTTDFDAILRKRQPKCERARSIVVSMRRLRVLGRVA